MPPISPLDGIAAKFVQLAHQLNIHNPGYVDAYYGPLDLKPIIEDPTTYPLSGIITEAGRLRDELRSTLEGHPQRRHYLALNLRALEMRARVVAGEPVSLRDEMRACYDVEPIWREESVLTGLHQELADLLPTSGDPLAARYQQHILERRSIPAGQALQLLATDILPSLRTMTAALFPLPEMATIALGLAFNVSWSGYNFYLGAFRAGVKFNGDKPMELPQLALIAAHEAWPGHATDLSIHEALLGIGQGRVEHLISLFGSPWCVVGETLAMLGLQVLMSPDEIIDFQQFLFARADRSALDATREQRITEIHSALRSVQGNMCLMLEENASEDEVLAYVKQWWLETDAGAARTLQFIKVFGRAYPFTYYVGRPSMQALFDRPEGKLYWANRILTEPTTPSQIRAWVKDGPLALPPLEGDLV